MHFPEVEIGNIVHRSFNTTSVAVIILNSRNKTEGSYKLSAGMPEQRELKET